MNKKIKKNIFINNNNIKKIYIKKYKNIFLYKKKKKCYINKYNKILFKINNILLYFIIYKKKNIKKKILLNNIIKKYSITKNKIKQLIIKNNINLKKKIDLLYFEYDKSLKNKKREINDNFGDFLHNLDFIYDFDPDIFVFDDEEFGRALRENEDIKSDYYRFIRERKEKDLDQYNEFLLE
jgi:hypothetical protein